MRVALAFFGLPRATEATFDSIREQLIEPLAACGELAVFRHFYRQHRVVNPRSGEDHPLDEANYRPFAAYPGIEEEPEAWLQGYDAGPLMAFGDAWNDGFFSLRNLLLQLHSLQAVTALAAKWSPDVVVFARPDMKYHDAIRVGDIERAFHRPREAAVPAWQWWGGHNDRFAICGRDAYACYGNRLDIALNFCRTLGQPLHSERLLWFALYTHGIDIRALALRASRVRAGGRIENESFEPVPEGVAMRSSLAVNPAGTGRRGR